MNQKLVIVESPAKARTIGKMLGSNYIIKASMGHVRDLPERTFGVDIKKDFTPQYEESKERGKNLSELKSAAKSAEEIYLAPDPDREGEAIAWHLKEILTKSNKKAKFHRVTFHEITKSAIAKAFESPSVINIDRVDAQQARRVLDRIVGYMVSPLLWGKLKKGLSAGRVQSVALRLVCERERLILAFVPQEYWNFLAKFSPDANKKEKFVARLFKINGEKFEVNNQKDADALLAAVKGAASWKIDKIEHQPRKKNAAPPFITSTLQQAASSSLGFSANMTMRTAQQLYEGVDVGRGGPTGLITYMRTDSVAVAVEAQNTARAFIASAYGEEYVPAKPNYYKSKASAQGAHEAIRPTDVMLTPEKAKEFLDDRMLRLYTLIWRRFVASQMAQAEQLRTTVDITANGSDSKSYNFRATATITKFPGFLRAYDIKEEGSEEEEEENRDAEILKALKQGDLCRLVDALTEQKFTEPPPRYSEATLIKELELNGIGRPSTYATIVNTIQERLYVLKEKGKLIPTELGFQINDYLVASLPELFQVGFTAEMENQLDEVEAGHVQWTAMMHDFYEKFEKWLNAAKSEGAPDVEKVKPLMALLGSVQQWDAPEKGMTRTFDDKKFFTSLEKNFEAGKAVSARQWEAMLKLAVKYESQLPALEKTATAHGFAPDLANAAEEIQKRLIQQEEWQAKREEAAANAPPQNDMGKVFGAMDNVEWNAPEKGGRRVYDDKKFYTSLKTQSENGRALSEKQLAALAKMATKYQAQIKDFEQIAEILKVTPQDAAAASPETAAAANTEADELLEKFSHIKTWNEPKKVGRRVYDDKEFYDSLAKQRSAGKALSDRQLAALKKLAGKYSL